MGLSREFDTLRFAEEGAYFAGPKAWERYGARYERARIALRTAYERARKRFPHHPLVRRLTKNDIEELTSLPLSARGEVE
jgi:hypothetical protein